MYRLRNPFAFVIFILCCLLSVSCKSKGQIEETETSANNTENQTPIELADPTIFYDNGLYYLYGTGGNVNRGFLVYTSSDLENWEGPKGQNEGYALTKGETYGTQGFWAPQIFRYKDKIYMAYTANEQIAIAESDSPLGPFRQTEVKKISGAERQIDPYVFFDDDGKIYLYHVRLEDGNKLYVAEMKEDLSDVKAETAKLCIEAEPNTWEDTENVDWRVSEGPTVLKHEGLYYFFYSANDFRNIDYAVGYATSASPLGPWKKSANNPIISRVSVCQNGSGHGDFFQDANGSWRYVFHVHASDSVVSPRRTAIVSGYFRDEKGEVGIEKISFRILKTESGNKEKQK